MKTLKNWLLKYLFCTVVPEDIITCETNGKIITQIYIGKDKITSTELNNLYAEVQFLEESQLWKLLTASLVERADKRMFHDAKAVDDLIFGKAMLYTIDTQKKIIDTIKRYAQLA